MHPKQKLWQLCVGHLRVRRFRSGRSVNLHTVATNRLTASGVQPFQSENDAMNNSSPTTSTLETTFGSSNANCDVFAVRSGTPINEALEHASGMLATALTLAAEMADADLRTCRALGQAVGHFMEASKVLVDASVDGMQPPAA